MNRRVDEEFWVRTTFAVLQEVGERLVEHSNFLRTFGRDGKDRVEMSEGSCDERCFYTEYSRNLQPGQRVKRQGHRTQNPPQINANSGVLDIQKRVN